jgi:hypothetical protein
MRACALRVREQMRYVQSHRMDQQQNMRSKL